MRINYFSDIHLEFGNLTLPETNADIVIAAGDIGIGLQGVQWLKRINKPVIYIAGNHEFYTHEYKRTLAVLRGSCANSNVQFLEKNVFIFQGIRFIGCTLWTDLFVNGEEMATELGLRLNDFRTVRFNDGSFDPIIFTQLHRRSLVWLENTLAEPFGGETIVVTHHAPLRWSWKEGANILKRTAYCNSLDELVKKHDILAWFHGHIHSPNDYSVSGTRVLSNPRGYHGRKEVADFNQNKLIEI